MAGRKLWSAMLFAPAVLQPSMVWSAAPSCAVKGKGYNDPDITVINGGIEIADATACQAMCTKSPNCKVFTFYITSGGCWLQGMNGMVPPLEPIPGVMSGPRACPDSDSHSGADSDSTSDADSDSTGDVTGDVGTDLGASPADASEKNVVLTDDNAAKSLTTGESTGKEDGHGSGFPVWAGVMIALLAIVGAVVGFYVFRGDNTKGAKTQKTTKKRGADLSGASSPALPVVSAKDAADVEAPLIPVARTASAATSFASATPVVPTRAAVPLPTVTTAIPTYTSVAPPVVVASETQPMVATPKIVTRAAPLAVRGGSATFSIAASPVISHTTAALAEPIAQQHVVVRPTRQQDLFDRLDTNHDGVITREEFGALAQ